MREKQRASVRKPVGAVLTAQANEFAPTDRVFVRAVLTHVYDVTDYQDCLMERDGLRQADLAEIGNQAKVSEILSGKRRINVRQAKALAARFGVEVALFFEARKPSLLSAGILSSTWSPICASIPPSNQFHGSQVKDCCIFASLL